jgi:ABC transporter substrate binding protein
MNRRDFITLLGGPAAWPLAAGAQPVGKLPTIGYLGTAAASAWAPWTAAFVQRLNELGWIDGRTVAIQYRWAEGRAERLAVSNLLVELGSKQLGLLRELAPGSTVVASLMNPNFPGTERQLRDVEAAATRVLGIQLIVLQASTDREIDVAFVTIAQQSGAALLVGVDPFFNERRDHIVALAARHAIPAIYSVREFAVAGGLMSYGSDFAGSYRQAGIYTGRVSRGEKPADLPVQRSA